MRLTCVVTAVLAACVFAAAAPVPKDKKKKTLEDKVLGKWKLIASQGEAVPTPYFYIVYKKDGEMEFRREYAGRAPSVSKGKYKPGEPDDENKLGTIDWTVNEGGGERGELSRITELTDDVLEFKDPQGVVERFERVKEDEKKEEKKEEKKDK
jgi:uncharacterized protein (TIGR03066 family)